MCQRPKRLFESVVRNILAGFHNRNALFLEPFDRIHGFVESLGSRKCHQGHFSCPTRGIVVNCGFFSGLRHSRVKGRSKDPWAFVGLLQFVGFLPVCWVVRMFRQTTANY